MVSLSTLCNGGNVGFKLDLLKLQSCWSTLPEKSRRGLAHDVNRHSVTYAGLVHVTDTDCQTQNDSTHVRVFATSTC